MNALIEARIKDLLKYEFHYKDYDCGTVVECVRNQAQMAGFDLDDRFAFAGLGAGPEARVASRLVGRVVFAEGDETPEYEMRKTIDMWIRQNPRKGK